MEKFSRLHDEMRKETAESQVGDIRALIKGLRMNRMHIGSV